MTNQDQKTSPQANQNQTKSEQKPDVVAEPKSGDREQTSAQAGGKDQRGNNATKA